MSRHGSFGSFVVGLIVGTSIGATWALLKAPRSGEETQRHLKRAAEELRREADNVVSTTRTHVQQAQEELSQHLDEIRAASEAALKETRQLVTQSAEKAGEEIEDGAKSAQEGVEG